MQETTAKYQYEGFSRIYIACARTNTQKLIDMLESMFGDVDEDNMDPQQLETKETKAQHRKAAWAEEAAISKEHRAIPEDKITRVIVRSTPVSTECRIPLISIPESENVKVPSAANPAKKVSHFYYNCKHCAKSSQSKTSMMTHTHHCLSIKLVCGGCKKEYNSSEAMERHINDAHKGDVDMSQ